MTTTSLPKCVSMPEVPWNSRGLVSLWDIMGQLIIQQFAYMIQTIHEMQANIVRGDASSTIPVDALENYIIPYLGFFQGQCQQIEFEKGVWQVEAVKTVARRGELTFAHLRSELERLLKDIQWELGSTFVYYSPKIRAATCLEMKMFWKNIVDAFPHAFADIDDAAFCYALERDTACVFHLMRVVEHGLRALAKKLKVTLTDKGKRIPIEYATWQKVIEAINSNIEVAHKLPQSTKRAEQLEFYSDLADHCSYMKDVWRNNLAHTRKRYIREEALLTIRRVFGFMDLLAKRL
jgi:hypothetical protein